ncbi:extracellular solute-binding protein [Oscillibacter hominis]|uniref:Extracellular solute-binding protein n=1 Tax=Oscillibacter hominis TaxID=2763056 RepID=A0A7G9B1V1_9FIRM|nr:extracellular solute-binding protein [Oscillibacter hominis]QNL43532.1 extracellular solute-binding protein [Oscillibacter hominis]
MKQFLASLLLILCLTGCGSTQKLDPKNPVTVTMWHNYGGDMQESMDYLIDKFNSTVGKEQGIVINVTAISSSSELNESLNMIANGDPGAPEMPDIFTGYPKIAVLFQEKGMLVNLDNYFTAEELSAYVDAFVEEGRLSDGGLYVFPLAKSTEILYLNQTLFDRFAAETGAKVEQLSTFEGLAELSRLYYGWSGGKQFYSADSWFNVAEVGMVQLGESLFDDAGMLSLNSDAYAHIFETIYCPSVEGGFAVYDGYSSDLSKTGDLVCSTGSSAGILFYGDTITYSDGTVEDVEYSILPYPVFEGGQTTALQRGGGLMVAKSDEKTECAASVFLKWLTASEQNMLFISSTGYLPVTKQAFEQDMAGHMESLDDARIRKMLTAVLSMYENYDLFTAPSFSTFDAISKSYEEDFKALLTEQRQLGAEALSVQDALTLIRK